MFIGSKGLLDQADESTSLLVLAWKEMFDPLTPDSFQPRLFNVPLLLRELGEIAGRASASPDRWQHHFEWVREELTAAISSEAGFLGEMPYYASICRRLTAMPDLLEVQRLCKTLAAYEEPYEEAAKGAFTAAVAKLPKDKELAVQALHRIATISLRCGFGTEEFQDVLDDHAYKLDPKIWASNFLAAFEEAKRPEREFGCYIPVSGVDPKAYLKMLKSKPEFRLLPPSELPHKLPKFFKHAAVFYIERVLANTSTEAARRAVGTLRPSLDILSFYDHELVPRIGEAAWVEHDGKGKLVTIAGQFLRSLPSRKSAVPLTLNALQIRGDLLTGKVLNALEHLQLAKSNPAFRAKLMNLWSALECLSVAGEEKGSVFSRVRDTVVPIVVWRRTDKIARYIAKNLTRLRQSALVENYGPLFSGVGYVSAEEVLLALTKRQEHPDLSPFYASVAQHQLVKNRFFALRKTFSNPKNLLSDLRNSTARTTWHLARIYRARNLIVHEGQEDAVVPHLVDNLQYYLSITLSRILHGMSTHTGWDVTDSVAHWRSKSWYITQMLDESPASLQVRDFFPIPRRHVRQQVWPASTLPPTGPTPAAPAATGSPPAPPTTPTGTAAETAI